MKYLSSISTVVAAALLLAAAPAAHAQTADERTPRELEGVGIQEHLGAKVDLNLTFVAEDGYPHALKEYFHKGRPVILNLVYYTCPMLCTLVLNGQTEALRKLPQTIGKEFDVVTISIDPRDDFGMARTKKAGYLESYERPTDGWHFLIDHEGNVAKLAKQVGFNYKFDKVTDQYAHAAGIFVLSPEGMVSRYLYGVKFKPLDIRLALTEAAGERTTVGEKILFYCFHYDPAARSYVPFAQNFMRMGGVLALAIFGFVLLRLWRRERRQSHANRQMVTAK
ncbi:MAG: SCO family protein [Acidobacteria bacterium]|nr:SCO family protein [Acidobacteriota bacterium]